MGGMWRVMCPADKAWCYEKESCSESCRIDGDLCPRCGTKQYGILHDDEDGESCIESLRVELDTAEAENRLLRYMLNGEKRKQGFLEWLFGF